MIFFQRTRKQILRTMPGAKPGKGIEQAVRDLVDAAAVIQAMVEPHGRNWSTASKRYWKWRRRG